MENDPRDLSSEERTKLTVGQRLLTALPNLDRRKPAVEPAAPPARKESELEETPDGGRRETSSRPPAGRPAPKPDPTSEMTDEELATAIKRIDDRERFYALVAGPVGAVLGIALTALALHYNPHVGQKGHESAGVIYAYGGARILLGALVVLAALSRRRSLVGFALLFMGTAEGFPLALIFWALGGWMIWRVFRYQKVLTQRKTARQRGASGAGPRAAARSGSADARERVRARREERQRKRHKDSVPTGPPPSKRYTPPKPTRARPPASS